MEDKIEDLKQELKEIKKDLISVVDADELEDRWADLHVELLLYYLHIEVNRLAGTKEEKHPPTVSGVTNITGIKLPRIEVPTFDLELADLLGAIWQRYP